MWHRHGDLSFGSHHKTNGYSDHQGTQATHDAHTDVTIHHDTGSFIEPLDGRYSDPYTSQHGMDSIIYKISAAGVPISVFAADTLPLVDDAGVELTDAQIVAAHAAALANESSINGRYGGYSFINSLDAFDGQPDMLAAVGSFRGSLKFPKADGSRLEITNDKYGQWDAFVSKIDMGTGAVVWATSDGIAERDPDHSDGGSPLVRDNFDNGAAVGITFASLAPDGGAPGRKRRRIQGIVGG